MDPEYVDKKIVDLSDAELQALGFLDEDVSPDIARIVGDIKADPKRLGCVTCFMVDCLRRKNKRMREALTASSTRRSAQPLTRDPFSVVSPNLISEFEMNRWYYGISINPPRLLWRSDYETNHFRHGPAPASHIFTLPTKTAYGVFNTPLNGVWHDVAPRILASIKARGIKYSALTTVRFSMLEADEYGREETFGPVVVWIAVRPNTTTSVAVRDATPAILSILADAQITGVVVEWYEASVSRLAGPPLMEVEGFFNPEFGLNHPFNTGLGIPIARQSDDAEGTVALLFKEMKTSNGEPSEKVLALTTKHVASVDTTTDYEFDGTSPQHILVCGERRFARAVNEIEDAITARLYDVVGLAKDIEDLESSLGTSKEDEATLESCKIRLELKTEDISRLHTFFHKVQADWRDVNGRKLGVVHWAPSISVDADDSHYTRDIAIVEVDGEKLENFKGNTVDLGNQYRSYQLGRIFWPDTDNCNGKEIPGSLQLPIRRILTPENKDDDTRHIVGKYGDTTKLTLGRYSGMDAFICTDDGLESREVAIYNYCQKYAHFARNGDSGSLIFTGEGDALAIVHSGMPQGGHSHVTFGTPMWWIVEQVLAKYPFAEFYGVTYERSGD